MKLPVYVNHCDTNGLQGGITPDGLYFGLSNHSTYSLRRITVFHDGTKVEKSFEKKRAKKCEAMGFTYGIDEDIWDYLIQLGFVKIQSIFGGRIFYTQLAKKQFKTLRKIGIIINEKKSFILEGSFI